MNAHIIMAKVIVLGVGSPSIISVPPSPLSEEQSIPIGLRLAVSPAFLNLFFFTGALVTMGGDPTHKTKHYMQMDE